jgi:hypothetical protein
VRSLRLHLGRREEGKSVFANTYMEADNLFCGFQVELLESGVGSGIGVVRETG